MPTKKYMQDNLIWLPQVPFCYSHNAANTNNLKAFIYNYVAITFTIISGPVTTANTVK